MVRIEVMEFCILDTIGTVSVIASVISLSEFVRDFPPVPRNIRVSALKPRVGLTDPYEP